MQLARGMWDWMKKLWCHKWRGRGKPSGDPEVLSKEVEELIRQRLAGLGYIESEGSGRL